jgi:hypothetical protein
VIDGQSARASAALPSPLNARIAAVDWAAIARDLDAQGHALIPRLLPAQDCEALAGRYDAEDIYRSRVTMARHGFGRGEYKYLAYPLPSLVQQLRATLYPHLAPIANRWNRALHIDGEYPPEHAAYIERCNAAGQRRPTPLMLRYGAGDHNCLHQDMYGDEVFPLQLTILLSQPDRDFSGGEFVLVEQRPRRQSRVEVVPLQQGDGVIFAVHRRPAEGQRGTYSVSLRHGVSRVRSGLRHTLGMIFHDAA